ncbi:MAG: alanine racemase [Gemmatimonadales bacterium]
MTKLTLEEPRRAWLDVNLAALVRNARRYQQLAGAPLLPMVKANGYGLGAIPVARALEVVEPWGYGVATIEEGAELRAAAITRPIVVFTPLAADSGDIAAMRSIQLRPVIGDLAALEAWLASSGGPFHVEIDSGMSRAGFSWRDGTALQSLGERLSHAGSSWEAIFTHFHSADSDPASVRVQLERFELVVAELPQRSCLVHTANSAAAQLDPAVGGDLARPGIFLYGGSAGRLVPEPVARLGARVIALRRLEAGATVSYGAEWSAPVPTTIATLAIGYADGVPRSLGNRGLVEINGSLLPIVGRVTMDMTMIEARDTAVALGDVAILFGGLVTLDEQAARAGTVSYDLLTSLSARVPRRYHGGGS